MTTPGLVGTGTTVETGMAVGTSVETVAVGDARSRVAVGVATSAMGVGEGMLVGEGRAVGSPPSERLQPERTRMRGIPMMNRRVFFMTVLLSMYYCITAGLARSTACSNEQARLKQPSAV
jgi:hypothetical protein